MLKNKIYYKRYTKLVSLGFFNGHLTEVIDLKYSRYLAFRTNRSYSLLYDPFFTNIKKLYPIIRRCILRYNIFLFICLGEKIDFFLLSFYKVMKSMSSYFIYDWAFGVLTNYARISAKKYIEGNYCFSEFPDFVFLADVLGRQKTVMPELKRRNLFTVGLVAYNATYVDFPIPSNNSVEQLYFFLRLVIKIILIEYKVRNFYEK